MQFNTELFHVCSRPKFGNLCKASKSEWQLWFSKKNFDYQQPFVDEVHNLPVKPTKKQVRKLRRAFRKEAAQYA